MVQGELPLPSASADSQESTEEGTLKTVEDLLRARGEAITKGRVNFDGDIEYEP